MEYLPISELFDMEKGVLQSSKCTPGPYPFITAADEWKTHKEYSHDKEALLFAAAASGSLGRTHYVKGKFISSDLCFILTPKDPNQRPIDLQLYQFIFQQFQSDIVARTKAGTSKESISQRSLGEYRLPYISIDRQKAAMRKMVAVRAKKEALTTELTHQRALLKQLRQAILQEAVQGKLTEAWRGSRPELVSGPHHASELLKRIRAEKEALVKTGKLRKPKPLPPIKPEEVPFELPEGWVWARPIETCETIVDCPHSTPKFHPTGWLCIDTTCIDEFGVIDSAIRRVSEETFHARNQRWVPRAGDIIFTREGSIGNAMVMPEGMAVCLGQRVMLYSPARGILPDYFRYALICDSHTKAILGKHKGIGAKHVNMKDLRLVPIPIPPTAEQHAITDRVQTLLTQVGELESQLEGNAQMADALLQSVLSEVMGGPAAVRYAEAGGELPLAAEPQVRQGRATKASAQVQEGQ